MNCPGSVALLNLLGPSEATESEHAAAGTSAHHVAAECLKHGRETWEFIGEVVEGVEVTQEMVAAVAVYVDHCQSLLSNQDVKSYVEFPISSKIHPMFYGTVDFACVADSLLNIRDYKHGAGVLVEVEDNPQLMYYAYGVLQHHEDVRRVVMGIVQPNAFHPDGAIRKWAIRADYIHEWVNDTLVPAMHRTEVDDTLDAGPWCRFCPAKLICPMMQSLFGAACTGNPKVVVNLNADSLGRSYQYIQAVKSYIKALEEETFARLQKGTSVPGTKLVRKRGSREWVDGAAERLKVLGPDAYTVSELKSPFEMEKLGPTASALVKELAYQKEGGLTVALASDPKPEVKVQTTEETFAAALTGMKSQ